MKRLASIILGLVIIFGAISLYLRYQDSSPTPYGAISDYAIRVTSNAPQKVESVTIVSSTQSDSQGNEQTLLFRANEQGSQIHIAGYAIIRKSLFGWYVVKLQMTGKSPLSNDVMASLDWSDGIPVIYGQVFLANAAKVEAVFSDPNKGNIAISAEIPAGNFVLFGSQYSELTQFKILDVNGKVIKQFTRDELQNG
jgi:hypothetical protein